MIGHKFESPIPFFVLCITFMAQMDQSERKKIKHTSKRDVHPVLAFDNFITQNNIIKDHSSLDESELAFPH